MILPDWLYQRSLISPHSLAVVTGAGSWSFAQLEDYVNRASRWLAQQQVVPGQRVALLLRNGLPYVILVHALARLGAVMVPFNSRLTPTELKQLAASGAVHRLLYDEKHGAQGAFLAQTGLAATALGPRWVEELGQIDQAQYPADGPTVNLAQIQSIIFTSGTTGLPKGAQLTFGNHWWNAVGSCLNLGLVPRDRWLICLPLFHVGGLAILFRSVIYGITAIVHDGFQAHRVNEAIRQEGVTIVSVVADMLRRMLAHGEPLPYPDHLRCILVGGGPVPQPLLNEAARRQAPVVQTYGLTETASQFTTLSPADSLRKLGAAGKPLMPNQLKILPLDSHAKGGPAPTAAPLGPGEVGQIVVRGPSVTPGYFRQRAATERVLRSGWFYTGDLGYLDEEGFLYVVDRRDDLIISGGENIYPAEIEGVLLAHPLVLDAGVTGLPHPRWGQVAGAVVHAHVPPGYSGDLVAELKTFCAQRLAKYKVPVKFRLVDKLPRNAAGKLLRRQLPTFFSEAEH